MDSKLAADEGFLCDIACDILCAKKHDEKYALYKATCYNSSLNLF
jgi:hypothetical protein